MPNLTVPRIIRSLITLLIIITPLEVFLSFDDIFLSEELQKIAYDVPSFFDSWSLYGIYFLLSIAVLIYLIEIISLVGLFFFRDWARWTISLLLVLDVSFSLLAFFLMPQEPVIESLGLSSVSDTRFLLLGAIVTIVWMTRYPTAPKT